MKVLLVAPSIDPNAVGEELWGYELATALAAELDVEIIAQTSANRDYSIADFFPGVRVHTCTSWTLPTAAARLNALIKPNYLKFSQHAARVLSQLDLTRFDCAHQFGPLGLRYPSPLRKFDLPYVIGPLGGSLPTPPALAAHSGKEPWYYKLRDFDGLRFRRDPQLRATFSRAATVVGVADYVKDILRDIPLQAFETCSEIAAPAPPENIASVLDARKNHKGPLRLLSASRLVISKGVQFGLEALARLSDAHIDWTWNILGDGVERHRLEAQCVSLGLSDRVTFHGQVPFDTMNEHYDKADVFFFPSIREPSGRVVFEAMSRGLPIIAANYGGPHSHVSDDFGVKVDVTDRNAFVDGLASAVDQLARAPDQRAAMGENAVRTAVGPRSMSANVAFFSDLYRQAAANGRPL